MTNESDDHWGWLPEAQAKLEREVIAATIKLCAQVALNCDMSYTSSIQQIRETIAAAIRALATDKQP